MSSPQDTSHAAKATRDPQDKGYAAKATTNPFKESPMSSTIYGIDFGTGAALAIHGPNGPVAKKDLQLPRVPGGRTARDEFTLVLRALFAGSPDVPAGDVVVESPTIGSSGCEPDDVLEVLAEHPRRKLFTISARAVKNYRQTAGADYRKAHRKYVVEAPDEQAVVHVEEAEIIYLIATTRADRLYRWTGPSEVCERIHTSVRPMDKRGYRDERAERYMADLPPFETLPEELRQTLGNLKGDAYMRSLVMPFAMASEEPYVDAGPLDKRKRRYEKVIGLYDRGYPSFYRRATIDWMIRVLKSQTGLAHKADATPEQRKQAQKTSQRQIRWFFHLTMAHQGR